MPDNSNHGRTLWDLIAENPIISLIFIVAFFGFTGYVVLTLIDKKYSFNSPVFSFQPNPPTIEQDTSKKSKLDTTYKINDINPSKKNNSKRQIVIETPNKDTIKSQVVNVTSNNQIGGITANQVNIGPSARKLDLTLTNQLLNFIQDKNSNIDVTSVLGDPEAFQFATSIKNFLTTQGYKNVNGVNQALFSQPVVGQFLNSDSSGIKILIGSNKNK